MKRLGRSWLWLIALTLSLATALPAAAQDDPVAVVQEATADVIELINEARGYYGTDPARFHQQVDALLSPIVDFDAFTRGVMGHYASPRYFETLKGDARSRYRSQVETFQQRFKQGLIETYAKGLLNFSGQRIETLPLRAGEAERPQVNVVQQIYASGEQPYVVQYTLRKNRAGEWKVRNVIVEGINLGQTYRNQFAALMEQHRGDMDKVIAAWRVEPAPGADEAG